MIKKKITEAPDCLFDGLDYRGELLELCKRAREKGATRLRSQFYGGSDEACFDGYGADGDYEMDDHDAWLLPACWYGAFSGVGEGDGYGGTIIVNTETEEIALVHEWAMEYAESVENSGGDPWQNQ